MIFKNTTKQTIQHMLAILLLERDIKEPLPEWVEKLEFSNLFIEGDTAIPEFLRGKEMTLKRLHLHDEQWI